MSAPKPKPKPHLAVVLRCRQALFECEPEFQSRLKALFAYRHPRADFIPLVQSGEWDGMINMMQRGRVSAGLFHAKRKLINKLFQVEVEEEVVRPQFRPAEEGSKDHSAPLRPYQQRAVQAMIDASGLGGIILSATGSGKTKLAGEYFKRLIGTGVFIVDELTLLEQARGEIAKAAGETVGIVGKSEFAPQRITVATVQTLFKHRHKTQFQKWYRQIDVLVIDELHVQLNRRNFGAVTQIKPKAVFGLTATLQLKKPEVSLPAIALCGPVIFEYPIQQGVEEGYLSAGQIVIVPFYDPLRGLAPGYWSRGPKGRIWVEAGSAAADYRYHICLNKARNDLVEKLVRQSLSQGRRIILLVERKLHLRKLSKRLEDSPHYALSGEVDAATRRQAMHQMDAGTLRLILASRVFAKGVDVRQVDCIIDATGLPSHDNALQRYGRGARKAEGKVLLYYDVADRNSPFADAAWARYRALQEIGAPIAVLD